MIGASIRTKQLRKLPPVRAFLAVAAVGSIAGNTNLVRFLYPTGSLASGRSCADERAAGKWAGNTPRPPWVGAEGGGALLPDWRIVTDCSTYNLDCAAHNRGRYGDYPFRVDRGITVADVGRYEWTYLSALPPEWAQSLREHAPTSGANGTAAAASPASAYVYPLEIPRKQVEACARNAEDMSFEKQLDATLSRLKGDMDLDMVAFTISDRKYFHDMLHDVVEMVRDIIGFPDGFFFVALDRFTVEHACKYGYPVVAAPGSLAEDGSSLKALVRNAKFAVSRALVERSQDFFFFEMDVWFLRSPKPLLKQQRSDLLVSSHQWNPTGGNIGVYAARSSNATRAFFRDCVELSAFSPNTHDQLVMNDLANVNHEILLGNTPHNKTFGRWSDPVPPVPKYLPHPMSRTFFGPHHIVASPHPIPTEVTVAIHPLDMEPLREPHGKKIMAKELGAWTGFRGSPETGGGYYARSGPRRRYLMMDGRVLGGYSLVEAEFYHSFRLKQWTVAALVALARRTGRILILPRILGDFHVHFLWTVLDVQSLEGIVEVRETNFPSNPKAWYNQSTPFRTVARMALFKKGFLFAQVPGGDDVQAWQVKSEGDQVDALFAISTAMADIREAEALLINPFFVQDRYINKFAMGEHLSISDVEIKEVFFQLRWCDDKLGSIGAGQTGSQHDCYGRGRKVDS